MFNTNKRQTKIVDLLKKKGHLTASQIANEVEVCTRTIVTDMQFLKTIFPEIVAAKGNSVNKGYRWEER